MRRASANLDAVKTKRIGFLTNCCVTAIVGGYSSSTLGFAYTYPGNVTDQIKIMGSATASLLPGLAADWTTPFWCVDASSGHRAFRMHNAAQIQVAGSDGKAHVVVCQATLKQLSTALMQAKKAATLDTTVWSLPGLAERNPV